ncbi:unnamed protein product [Schistosoma mattheei]|uniref:Uncharacterized protein n=1 Tax=Schistosoma mattheei TaxID=31246 RepID=A0A183PBC1_9TREM|nr:unnamed protein product [Schistosoma mattheei]
MPQELLKRRVQSQLTKACFYSSLVVVEHLSLFCVYQLFELFVAAREEGLRRQARLLRRQEEKRLRAERRAMAIELGSVPGNSSDSSSHSSSSSGSSYHNSSRARSRRFQASPVRRQSSMYSSGSRKYSPPPLHSSYSRPRIESERGLLGSPSRVVDARLPSPPSNTNLCNFPRDTRVPINRIPRSSNSLLGSPIQNSYSTSRDRGSVSSSSSRFIGSREEQRSYSSMRPHTSLRGELAKRSDE